MAKDHVESSSTVKQSVWNQLLSQSCVVHCAVPLRLSTPLDKMCLWVWGLCFSGHRFSGWMFAIYVRFKSGMHACYVKLESVILAVQDIWCACVCTSVNQPVWPRVLLLVLMWPLSPTVATAPPTEPQVTEPKAPTKYIPPAKRYGSDAKREGESMATRTRG